MSRKFVIGACAYVLFVTAVAVFYMAERRRTQEFERKQMELRAIVGPRSAGEAGTIQLGNDKLLMFLCYAKNACAVKLLEDIQ